MTTATTHYCQACWREFRSLDSWLRHMQSRKHADAIARRRHNMTSADL